MSETESTGAESSKPVPGSNKPHLPYLPCPECKRNGLKGTQRIGSNRRACKTCNNFAQAVYRLSRRRLVEKHAAEYETLRLSIELDLYPAVMDAWLKKAGLR